MVYQAKKSRPELLSHHQPGAPAHHLQASNQSPTRWIMLTGTTGAECYSGRRAKAPQCAGALLHGRFCKPPAGRIVVGELRSEPGFISRDRITSPFNKAGPAKLPFYSAGTQFYSSKRRCCNSHARHPTICALLLLLCSRWPWRPSRLQRRACDHGKHQVPTTRAGRVRC